MKTDWKLLPVPAADYDELEAEVQRRQSERGAEAIPTIRDVRNREALREDVVRRAFAPRQSWEETDLHRLSAGLTATTRRFARVMDEAVKVRDEHDGRDWALSTSEVAERTGMTVNEWRDACRKMGAHMKKHYPDVPKHESGEPMWPLVNYWGTDAGQSEELYVGITAEQATRWTAVR